MEEDKRNLQIVLHTLWEHQLYTKYSKCEFYKYWMKYLGHVVSQEGMTIEPEKIKAIMEWPIPKSVVDIRSFRV